MGVPEIDPGSAPAALLALLVASYGYVLYYASYLISRGSDLLLLVPSLAGLVGGVVLPLLGAVPDGAIMLFSGLGDAERAQGTLSVGVGALAGSTIMLLTVPWGMSVLGGRVDFRGPGMAPDYGGRPKLGRGVPACSSLTATGVALGPEVHHGARWMMLTTLPYFLIEAPAVFGWGVRYWAAAGFVACVVFFAAYLYTEVRMSNHAARKRRRAKAIRESVGESVSPEQLNLAFSRFNQDRDGPIDYDEFVHACYVLHDDDDEEEEEEAPADLASLPPEEQQRAIKRRALLMLSVGTALVLLFTGPMVDVLSEVAGRAGIPAFYVSFVLAPLAANASEVIATQYYAKKKTRRSIAVALTALEGAAAMNNTFCLAIFMALIFFRGLEWEYSAETVSIVLVQFGMGAWALHDKMSMMTALVVLALFPLSISLVALLEYLGFD